MTQHLARIAVLTAVLILAIAACSGPNTTPAGSTPPVDQPTAIAIAENAFDGYNSGDYATWARDWSDTMRGAIDARAFQSFRDQLLPMTGRYVAIKDVAYEHTKPTVHRYTFTVEFEKLTSTVWFGYYAGSPKVEGVKFE